MTNATSEHPSGNSGALTMEQLRLLNKNRPGYKSSSFTADKGYFPLIKDRKHAESLYQEMMEIRSVMGMYNTYKPRPGRKLAGTPKTINITELSNALRAAENLQLRLELGVKWGKISTHKISLPMDNHSAMSEHEHLTRHTLKDDGPVEPLVPVMVPADVSDRKRSPRTYKVSISRMQRKEQSSESDTLLGLVPHIPGLRPKRRNTPKHLASPSTPDVLPSPSPTPATIAHTQPPKPRQPGSTNSPKLNAKLFKPKLKNGKGVVEAMQSQRARNRIPLRNKQSFLLLNPLPKANRTSSRQQHTSTVHDISASRNARVTYAAGPRIPLRPLIPESVPKKYPRAPCSRAQSMAPAQPRQIPTINGRSSRDRGSERHLIQPAVAGVTTPNEPGSRCMPAPKPAPYQAVYSPSNQKCIGINARLGNRLLPNRGIASPAPTAVKATRENLRTAPVAQAPKRQQAKPIPGKLPQLDNGNASHPPVTLRGRPPIQNVTAKAIRPDQRSLVNPSSLLGNTPKGKASAVRTVTKQLSPTRRV